jgi:ATP-binding cassette subfamily F protein uup
MDHLVDQLFVFEGDGLIRLFNGNYSDYRTWLEEKEQVAETKPVKAVVTEDKTPLTDKKKATFKEKQEYEKLQAEIDELEKKKEEYTALINSGSSNDHQQLQKWASEIQRIANDVDAKTLRWIELSELV